MQNPKRNFGKLKLNHISLAHDLEHKNWSRRSFLQTLGLAGSGSIFFAGTAMSASKVSPLTMALNEVQGERVLVLIRLKGGNDGLNTIVPIQQFDTYANARPKIRYTEQSLYKLNDDYGMPEAMRPLQSLWGEGKMKVALGVGYDDGNLSHFRSSDIYASTVIEEKERTGFLGRYYQELLPDFLANPPAVPPAIQIGSIGNLLFDGDENHYAFTVAKPEQLERIAQTGAPYDVVNLPGCIYGDQLGFMRGLSNTTYKYADVIKDAYDASTTAADYDPEASLAKQLQIIARMIKGRLGTKIYMVTLNGFDTHANQIERHQELLADLADSVSKFYEDLAAAEMDGDVVAMTFSEFGRRVKENGSSGTDHGTSSTALFFGSGLNASGIIGEQPDLEDVDRTGNMKSTIDFRQLYTTVLKEWLCIPPNVVDGLFPEGPHENIALGANCIGINGIGADIAIQHTPTYQNGRTYIEFELPFDSHVDIQLFNIVGQRLGSIANDVMCKGTYKIDVKDRIATRLSTGQYVYRIFSNFKRASKLIQITN